MRKRRRRVCAGVTAGALCFGNLLAANGSASPGRDRVPSGVDTTDYALDFQVPPGLMPDPQFDGLPAEPAVHRVQPSDDTARTAVEGLSDALGLSMPLSPAVWRVLRTRASP
jgi:hypothetical protein